MSDSNKFVLIGSEGRGSVGKQLVPRTASVLHCCSATLPPISFWCKHHVDYIETGY